MGALTDRLRQLQAKLQSPDLITHLGLGLAENLVNEAPMDTGATKLALGKISEPNKTAIGWQIGVGDKTKTGDESTPAPRGTLEAFYKYLGVDDEESNIGRVWRITNWWGMSRANKDLLAQGRRAGLWGGRGIDYANYMWVQNSGNSEAGITSTHFLERALEQWRGQASQIIQDYLAY